MSLQTGAVICDHLEIDCAVDDTGSPLFGPAYAGKDSGTGQDLWLAAIDRQLLPGSINVSQFMAGANALARIRHPTLVRVIVVDREPEFCVVGYEWLPDARSVASLLAEKEHLDVSHCARETARGLAFLHKQGLSHGMFSAHTVLRWEDAFALWQYGLASLCDPARVVQRCRRLPDEVFAPEVLRQNAVTPVADVHAWGVLMARLGTGSDAVEAVNAVLQGIGDPDLPGALLEVTRRALDPSPDERPRDGVQLRVMVTEALRPRTRPGVPTRVPATPPPVTQDESGVLLGSGEFELVELDDDGSAPSGPPAPDPRAMAQEPGTGPPTTGELDLAALADEHAGGGDPILVPGGGLALQDDALDVALRDVAKSAPAALGVPFPGQDAVDPGPVGAGAPEGMLELPRRPGPHGPGALKMTGWLLFLMLTVVGLTTWRVALRAGGFHELLRLDLPSMPVVEDEPVALPTGAPADGTESGSGASEATEAGIPKLDVPDGADKHPSCPRGTVPVSDKICIDVAESPGLRRIPHVNIEHREAALACERRQGRLCTLKEWQRACYGPRRARYSYGSVFQGNRCNTASVAGFPQEVGLAGAYEGCVSAIGTHDMVGNVGEWVAEGIAAGGDSTTRGRIASCAAKGRPPPGYIGPDLGFRCCFDLFE